MSVNKIGDLHLTVLHAHSCPAYRAPPPGSLASSLVHPLFSRTGDRSPCSRSWLLVRECVSPKPFDQMSAHARWNWMKPSCALALPETREFIPLCWIRPSTPLTLTLLSKDLLLIASPTIFRPGLRLSAPLFIANEVLFRLSCC